MKSRLISINRFLPGWLIPSILLPAAVLALNVLFGSGPLWFGNEANAADNNDRRVVILGFDGLDYDLVEEFIEQGELPNLERLSEQGELRPLLSSTPPESPVAWSTMVTGTNPGKTGVFDFLRRNPDTYFPELNMTDVVQAPEFLFETVPISPPILQNARHGPAFWTYASEAGVNTIGIMMPMNMPPEEAPGSYIFSGLGVPDARKTMGTYVYYVEDMQVARDRTGSEDDTEMGGRVIRVDINDNEIETFIPGPFDPVRPGSTDELRADVAMTVDPGAGTLDFNITNKTPFRFIVFFGGAILTLLVMLILWWFLARALKNNARGFGIVAIIFIIFLAILGIVSRPTTSVFSTNVSEGEWSDWIPVKFLVTDWVPLEGFFRVYFIEAGPDFQVYVSPVSIDPRGTMVAISFPGSYAGELLDEYGYFKTYGWDTETWALNENVIDEETYLEDCYNNWDTKENMVLDQMKRDDWRLFATVFQATDHVSHMFWRTRDTAHPMYSDEIAEEYGEVILDIYRRSDDMVGRVMNEILDENDELIVMSDHGFNSFRYAVNLNRWLVDNGYMTEKPNLLGNLLGGQQRSVPELFKRQQEFFEWVDWSRTEAYALGLGQIYINLEGREAHGIVTENERDALIDEIIDGLLELTDPNTGQRVLVDAYRADDIYSGDNMEYSPDIVVGFADGYRVSWQTTLGVAAEDLVEPNAKKWSGDHCSFDPSVTLGVLFSTVPLTVDDPALIDLTPSILGLFGIDKPDRCDGRQIFDISEPE